MRIFVSNLAYKVTADDLKAVFVAYDKVEKVFIITDRTTGKSKGFGYVDITPDSEAKAAIEELTGRILQDRPLILQVALPPGDKKEGPSQPPKRLGNKDRHAKPGTAGPAGDKSARGRSPGGGKSTAGGKTAGSRDHKDGRPTRDKTTAGGKSGAGGKATASRDYQAGKRPAKNNNNSAKGHKPTSPKPPRH